jgi:hypothetical protein
MVHEKKKKLCPYVRNLEVIGTPSPSCETINIHVCLHMDVFWVIDEKSRIRIRTVQKFNGSATLLIKYH